MPKNRLHKPRSRIIAALLALFMLFGITTAIVMVASAGPARADSASEISGAVTWATNEMTTNPTGYYDLCLQFVADAYSKGGGVSIGSADTAYDYWTGHASAHVTDGSTPPEGALVFWGPDPWTTAGHVALSLGGGTVISSAERANNDIHEFTIADRNNAGYATYYLGWMMPPGVTASGGGSSGNSSSVYQAAFQANTGVLFTDNSSTGVASTNQGMAAGTNPSIASLPSGGYEEAFQANTGSLFVAGSDGTFDTGLGMAAGTSPSITGNSSGFQIAFQANTGTLYLYTWSNGSPAANNLNQGMAPGTSPAIATSSAGGFQAAFQANTGALYIFWSGSGAANTGYGMMQGTSPSITALSSGGYEQAFQANTGHLWEYGSGGSDDLGQGMEQNTNPAISADSSGFHITFQANTGSLYTFTSSTGTTASTNQGMASGTSPAIASP